MLFVNNAISQSTEIYVNEEHEVLILSEDSLAYRLKNNGGITTFSYNVSEYNRKGRRLKIKNSYFSFADLEVRNENKIGTTISLLNNDSIPIVGATINISIDRNDIYLSDNGNGKFEIPNSIIDKQIEMQVLSLGNTFQLQIIIAKDSQNIIVLKVPSEYGINNVSKLNRTCIRVNKRHEKTIQVFDQKTKEWKFFTLEKDNVYFKDALFYLWSK